MKTNKAEQWLLLEQSGELNAWQRWRLARHLRHHPELAAFREDLRRISDLSRATGPVDMPGWQVPGEIRRVAAEQQQTNHFAEAESGWWKPVLVTGLAALAVVTTYQMQPAAHRTRTTTPVVAVANHADDIDNEIENLNTLLAGGFDTIEATGEHRNADDLARELLAWEGQEI